jgi:mannosyl-oligosaccharide alpha-1,2-mannosidase
MALDRRVGRAIVAAAIFMTVLFFLQPARQHPYTESLYTESELPADGLPATPVPRPASGHPKISFRASSFDWTTVAPKHPVSSIRPLPTGPLSPLHQVQHAFPAYVHDTTTKRRQEAVRAAFVKSWGSYKKHAWLRDELTPVSGKGKTTFGGWAATIVDSLDTLWIMGLKDDFRDAAAAAVQLDWAKTTDTAANLFETTIRHLAGLISAYDLSHEPALLEKAKELGDMLYMAFDTPNGMPNFWFNFLDAKQGRQTAGTNDPSASPGTLSLEFTRLSILTGDPKYYDGIARIMDFLERTQDQTQIPGLWPKLINFREQTVGGGGGFSLGALADSLYEYLPKMSALLGGQVPAYEKMYRAAMVAAKKHMLFRPMVAEDDDEGQDVLFVGDAYVQSDSINQIAEGQHLSCFAGGMFGLGGKLFDITDHVAIGERLARGCSWAYNAFPTGLMPEIFNAVTCDSIDGPCPWDEERWIKEGGKNLPKGFKSAQDTRYILRPEAIESIFLMYRMTGKEEYRDLAWRMFESVVKSTETRLAFSAISDVTETGVTSKMDSMEVRRLLACLLDNTTDSPPEFLLRRNAQVLLLDLLAARPH